MLLFWHAVLFSTECILQSVYQTYWSIPNILSGAGNVAGKYGGELVRSILFGIPKIALFLLPPVLYLIFGKRVFRTRRLPGVFCAFLIAAGTVVFGWTALFAFAGKTAAIYGAQYDMNRATEAFGLTASTRLSLKYGLFGHPNASFHIEDEETQSTAEQEESASDAAEEVTPTETANPEDPYNRMEIDFSEAERAGGEVGALTEYILRSAPTKKNEYTGLFEGKNLIMVCAEAYCGAFIDPELTPTLWRLTRNGIYFSDFYQPSWGGSTTTGEMAFLVGLAGRYGDDSVLRIRDNNNYFAMGNQLQRLGYSSCAFHNGAYDYYGRNTTHVSLGYNSYVANETGIEDLCGTAYPPDSDLIADTVDLYLDKQPFSVYYMTISGHAPYEADNYCVEKYYDRVDSVVGDRYEETTKYYICYQMELEEAMRILVERLTAAGIADDTVIALVGDHYPYGLGNGEAWGNDQDYITDLLGHSDAAMYDQDENTLILWSGSLEGSDKSKAVEVGDPVSSLDIVPTLSNLFGLEYDSRLLPGRDVFSDSDPLVFWNDLSWVTKEGKYDARTETFIPAEGSDADSAYVEKIRKTVENKILLSRVIADNDYWGVLFGKDDLTFAGEWIYNEYGTGAGG